MHAPWRRYDLEVWLEDKRCSDLEWWINFGSTVHAGHIIELTDPSDRRVRKKCPSVLLSQFVGQSVDVAFVTCDRVVSMVGPPDTGRKIYGRLLKVCLDEPIIFCTTATIIQRWWVGGRKKVGELIRWELFLHGSIASKYSTGSNEEFFAYLSEETL